jgi:hypothetical protein
VWRIVSGAGLGAFCWGWWYSAGFRAARLSGCERRWVCYGNCVFRKHGRYGWGTAVQGGADKRLLCAQRGPSPELQSRRCFANVGRMSRSRFRHYGSCASGGFRIATSALRLLHPDLSEGVEPGQGDREDQATDAGTPGGICDSNRKGPVFSRPFFCLGRFHRMTSRKQPFRTIASLFFSD